MESKSFLAVFKKIDKSYQTARTQALNRAATSTRAKFAKEVSADIGLPSKLVKRRAKIIRATNKTPASIVSIGTRVIFAAHNFKPKRVKIQSRLGTRFGARISVKNQPKAVLPGAFIVKGKSSGKEVVVTRAGDARYPTKTVLVDVFFKAVVARRDELNQHMADSFEKNLKDQLVYRLGLK